MHHLKAKALNFNITNIIENQNLKVRLLHYEKCAIDSLDLSILSKTEQSRFHSFGADKRKREFYFTRLLWSKFDKTEPIVYTKTGKPEITTGHISISHSKTSIAISYSTDHKIGLDIEHYNPKIIRIKDKFLSDLEQEKFDLADPHIITTLWSIKEAVYKLCDIEGLSFRNHVQISKIGVQNQVQINTPKLRSELTFSRLIFDDFILTYCILK